jgi:hypothetical protein
MGILMDQFIGLEMLIRANETFVAHRYRDINLAIEEIMGQVTYWGRMCGAVGDALLINEDGGARKTGGRD